MDDIEQYYSQRVAQSQDLYWQVGKTINGQPVGTEQLTLIIDSIGSALDLNSTDIVLDIGCGNGLVTRKIAEQVSNITGIERNKALFSEAVRHKSGLNQYYANSDALSYKAEGIFANKLYLYEVIQHISHQQIVSFLTHLSSLLVDEGQKIFIGGVPDEERKWFFYDSPERREGLFRSLIGKGADPIGFWFHREEFYFLAKQLGMTAEIIEQPATLYTSHYRFNCLLSKN